MWCYLCQRGHWGGRTPNDCGGPPSLGEWLPKVVRWLRSEKQTLAFQEAAGACPVSVERGAYRSHSKLGLAQFQAWIFKVVWELGMSKPAHCARSYLACMSLEGAESWVTGALGSPWVRGGVEKQAIHRASQVWEATERKLSTRELQPEQTDCERSGCPVNDFNDKEQKKRHRKCCLL